MCILINKKYPHNVTDITDLLQQVHVPIKTQTYEHVTWLLCVHRTTANVICEH